MKKRLIIIGTLDGVHLARWNSQFINTATDITVFLSQRFRKDHSNLHRQLENDSVAILNTLPKNLILYRQLILEERR